MRRYTAAILLALATLLISPEALAQPQRVRGYTSVIYPLGDVTEGGDASIEVSVGDVYESAGSARVSFRFLVRNMSDDRIEIDPGTLRVSFMTHDDEGERERDLRRSDRDTTTRSGTVNGFTTVFKLGRGIDPANVRYLRLRFEVTIDGTRFTQFTPFVARAGTFYYTPDIEPFDTTGWHDLILLALKLAYAHDVFPFSPR